MSESKPNIAIIQARMGSTRLPGKALADIAGRPMLLHVVRRAAAARLIDRVVVATSTAPADDAIVQFCEDQQIDCFRGDESDVLRRYAAAAKRFDAGIVTRITSDCPLLDPRVTDEVIDAFQKANPDYASNTLVRSWPRGLDTEVMTIDALFGANRSATEPYHRTHVTPYIYENPDRFDLVSVLGSEDRSSHRWTVDTPEDLEFVRAVVSRLPDGSTDWKTLIQLIDETPELTTINTHVRQKETREG